MIWVHPRISKHCHAYILMYHKYYEHQNYYHQINPLRIQNMEIVRNHSKDTNYFFIL